jgi:hypothetical protein
VLLDRCGDNTHEFEFISGRRHPTSPLWQHRTLPKMNAPRLVRVIRDAIDGDLAILGLGMP